MYFIFMPLSYFPSGVVRKEVDIWNLEISWYMKKFNVPNDQIFFGKKIDSNI